MEQARISTSQGTQSPQQTARTRAHTQQKGVTDDGAGAAAQPDSFLALLAAQDPEFAEGAIRWPPFQVCRMPPAPWPPSIRPPWLVGRRWSQATVLPSNSEVRQGRAVIRRVRRA